MVPNHRRQGCDSFLTLTCPCANVADIACLRRRVHSVNLDFDGRASLWPG